MEKLVIYKLVIAASVVLMSGCTVIIGSDHASTRQTTSMMVDQDSKPESDEAM